jgi:hypothetical protein
VSPIVETESPVAELPAMIGDWGFG